MATEQKMVKVKILKPVMGWNVGDVVEVTEEQAKHMTTSRQVQSGSSLVDFQTAELADSGATVGKASYSIGQMTVKDMADIGMKNVVAPPKAMQGADGKVNPQLSTTTNEAIPHGTGAPMASIAVSDLKQEDMSSDSDSAGYDGANILSQSREGSGGKPVKAPQKGKVSESNSDQKEDSSVGTKIKEAANTVAQKVTGHK